MPLGYKLFLTPSSENDFKKQNMFYIILIYKICCVKNFSRTKTLN